MLGSINWAAVEKCEKDKKKREKIMKPFYRFSVLLYVYYIKR